MLDFKAVTIDDRQVLDSFLKEHGSGSCQHSFPALLGLAEKYGDEYCFVGDVLFIHRSRRDHDGFRVYLAPLGNISDGLAKSVQIVLDDAHSHSCKASFETVTGEFAEKLSGQTESFDIEPSEEYYEYIYSSESLSTLPGRELAAKRNRVRAFHAAYDGRFRIEELESDNLEDVRKFSERWFSEKMASADDIGLESEARALSVYLRHFTQLGFRGIAVYIDGQMAGYAAGVPISSDTVDEVIEKGLKDVTGIYQLLCTEFAKLFAEDYVFVNREEDLGIEGLRRAKLSYRPYRILKKYVIREKC